MIQSLFKTEIRDEVDVVRLRKCARDIAGYLGLDIQEQTRVATAVSEIARNAFEYAGGGVTEYRIQESRGRIELAIIIKDRGPGIQKLQEILQGTYRSPQGMGLGILGARRLMDKVEIESEPGKGTQVALKKIIPNRKHVLTPKEIHGVTELLVGTKNEGPLHELQRQNKEILLAMSDLTEKKGELQRINQELEDTNRGVVALYAELDEKADNLRLANESKTSFLSDLTHEFRSPLNSIIGIGQILLDEARAEHAPEREKQVNFIMKAARGLSELVNDLLDIAKIEAGKISVKPTEFHTVEIMSTLRGLMRPLTNSEHVPLQIEIGEDIDLFTDEAKLTQILRNLISNALKYTIQGEIIVTCRPSGTEHISFAVKDTGIGIPEEYHEKIFEEFFQVEHKRQGISKGTGLGLPLSRKLAVLLGGMITVKSGAGGGSVFTLTLPVHYSGQRTVEYTSQVKIGQVPVNVVRGRKKKILVVDDDESIIYHVKKVLENKDVELRTAKDGNEGFETCLIFQPDLVILDLVMPGSDGIDFIRHCLGRPSTKGVQILLHTSKALDEAEETYFKQVTTAIVPKGQEEFVELREAVWGLLGL